MLEWSFHGNLCRTIGPLTLHSQEMCSLSTRGAVLIFVFYTAQAVDVVGQAGKPKAITGFQTHTTPVLLAYGERAELATDECILFCL